MDSKRARYKDYVYPVWAVLFGYFIEIFPFLPVIFIMIWDIKHMKGKFYQVSFTTLNYMYKLRHKLKESKYEYAI